MTSLVVGGLFNAVAFAVYVEYIQKLKLQRLVVQSIRNSDTFLKIKWTSIQGRSEKT